MSGLDQVMNRLRKSPASEPQPKKKVVEEAPVLDDEETEEVEEDLEDEEDEEIEEPEEPVVPVKKVAPKQVQPKVVPEVKEEPNIEEMQSQRAEEVQLLQNNGIFRVEMLFQIGTLNKNLEEILKIIRG